MLYGSPPALQSVADLPYLMSPYRSGITITASYAIKQSTRLLKVTPIYLVHVSDERRIIFL